MELSFHLNADSARERNLCCDLIMIMLRRPAILKTRASIRRLAAAVADGKRGTKLPFLAAAAALNQSHYMYNPLPCQSQEKRRSPRSRGEFFPSCITYYYSSPQVRVFRNTTWSSSNVMLLSFASSTQVHSYVCVVTTKRRGVSRKREKDQPSP